MRWNCQIEHRKTVLGRARKLVLMCVLKHYTLVENNGINLQYILLETKWL